MNFNDIKASLESEEGAPQVPDRLAKLKESEMPIQKLRKKWLYYLIIVPFFLVFFLLQPSLINMTPIHRGVYYLVLFICIISQIGSTIKIVEFINKTGKVKYNSRDTIYSFLLEYNSLLEISSISFMPLYVLLAFLGYLQGESLRMIRDNIPYEQSGLSHLLTLDLNPYSILIFCIVTVLFLVSYNYFVIFSNKWLNRKYLNKLKEILASLEE